MPVTLHRPCRRRTPGQVIEIQVICGTCLETVSPLLRDNCHSTGCSYHRDSDPTSVDELTLRMICPVSEEHAELAWKDSSCDQGAGCLAICPLRAKTNGIR